MGKKSPASKGSARKSRAHPKARVDDAVDVETGDPAPPGSRTFDISGGEAAQEPDRAATGEESPATPPAGDVAGPDLASATAVTDAAVEDEAGTRVPPSARDVLERLLEKNEIILKLNAENAAHEAQLKELNDRWLRSVAEFENYRKRTRKERELLKQQSKVEVVLDVLGVIDDFERAFSVVEGEESSEFIQGIRLIFNSLVQVIERHNVREIQCAKQPFDPAQHMAVGQIETDDVDSGHIAEVVQKGYRLGDAVIRPARVIVAK